MANALYPLWKSSVMKEADTLNGLDQNTVNDGPYVALVPATYVYSAAHQFYSSLSGMAGTDQRVTTPSVGGIAAGVFSGDNLTYTAVGAGAAITALVLYRHNVGANTTWRLVMYEDTGVTGLPVTPNGGNITVTWSGSGIFQL